MSDAGSGIAAVLVTRNARTWLDTTVGSVLAQERPVDLLVVVDDGSTDGTPDAVRALAPQALVLPSRSTATDAVTRTAQNFTHGVIAAIEHNCDLVVLGDHDDTWHPGRVAHQAELLQADPTLAMVASDGVLAYDGSPGAVTRLREAFPIDPAFGSWSAADQLRYALGHSIATGGASAIRASVLAPVLVPPLGWLHDRWWSLAACAMGAMAVDDTAVIDYRVRAGQQVGLERGRQSASGAARAWATLRGAGGHLARARTLREGLLPVARDAQVRQALALSAIARAGA